jgi:hypothetical protein
MNTREQYFGESERQEGLGGRVRRFVDSEINRMLDKQDPDAPDRPMAPATAQPHEVTAEPHTAGYEPHTAGYEPHTAGYESSRYEPAASPEAESVQVRGRARDEAAADSSAERVGLLDNPAGLRAQWQQLQGTFVDDPQRAVQEASVLVERTLREIQENVTRGQISEPTSTEDLRVSFQRYREFFHRLLSA